MDDCVFCKIARGELPSKKVYEDENTLAFYDLTPQTPVHVLVISKHHTDSLTGEGELSDKELASVLRASAEVARLTGIEQSGYRVITNIGPDACQSVQHMHFHVMGGCPMTKQMA